MKISSTVKTSFLLIGLTIMLIGFIAFLQVFFSAYANETKKVSVDIDQYHEAEPERICLYIAIPIVLITYIVLLNKIIKCNSYTPIGERGES